MTCQRCTRRSNCMQAVSLLPNPAGGLRTCKPFGGAIAPCTAFESSPPNPPFFTQNQRVLSAAIRMVQLRPLQRGVQQWDLAGVAGRVEEVFCKA